MAAFPVWFLQAGQSEGSAALVWVRPLGSEVAEQRLLTAQHVLRTGADQRSGPYANFIKAWPPEVGFVPDTGFPVTVDQKLSPDPALPLADPEDFAFLKLPGEATGASPTGLLADARCVSGLAELTISGYSGGQEIIHVHAAVVRSAPHPDWVYENFLAASASGILSPGKGKPIGGVSGGGVFHRGQYAGVYRGAFENPGQQLFIPIPRLREWCLSRGYELVDLSLGAQIEVIVEGLTGIEKLLADPSVQAKIAASHAHILSLHAVLSEFRIYKLLHDHLHQVQLQFTSAAKAARADFADDEVINQFELAISAIKTALQGAEATHANIAASSAALKERERDWLIDLQKAVTLAKQATDSAKAAAACGKIGSVLKRHLPRINAELTVSARVMDLSKLGALFQAISQVPGLPPAHQQALQSGQAACEMVRQEIKQQTDVHGQWQEVDVNLWEAEGSLLLAAAGDPTNFLLQWNDIKTALATLMFNAPGADWATRVMQGLDAVTALVQAQGWGKMYGKFERLARDIRQQFFDVDQDLKAKAEKISELGKPLDPFL